MGASSLKSPASIWRGVVFVVLVVGMMAMGRGAWAAVNMPDNTPIIDLTTPEQEFDKCADKCRDEQCELENTQCITGNDPQYDSCMSACDEQHNAAKSSLSTSSSSYAPGPVGSGPTNVPNNIGTGSSTSSSSADNNESNQTFDYTLTITKEGKGSGTITSTPIDIACDANSTDCEQGYITGTPVTLTAAPDDDSSFRGWSGACGGLNFGEVILHRDNTTIVAMDDNRSCTAHFFGAESTLIELMIDTAIFGILSAVAIPSYDLYIDKSKVSEAFGLLVGIKTSAEVWMADFGEWPTDITQLDVVTNGQYVDEVWLEDYVVKAQMKSDAGDRIADGIITFAFDSENQTWQCTSNLPKAVLQKDCESSFQEMPTPSFSLNISNNAEGGSVSNTPTGFPKIYGGINYSPDTEVTLTAIPDAGFVFNYWVCTDDDSINRTNPRIVQMDKGRSCSVTFVPAQTLNITKTGNGSITSNPAGIDCGTDCEQDYATNAPVVLTATPANGATFIDWTGGDDCSGTNPITAVTMEEAKSCTANFTTSTIVTLKPTSVPSKVCKGQSFDVTFGVETTKTIGAMQAKLNFDQSLLNLSTKAVSLVAGGTAGVTGFDSATFTALWSASSGMKPPIDIPVGTTPLFKVTNLIPTTVGTLNFDFNSSQTWSKNVVEIDGLGLYEAGQPDPLTQTNQSLQITVEDCGSSPGKISKKVSGILASVAIPAYTDYISESKPEVNMAFVAGGGLWDYFVRLMNHITCCGNCPDYNDQPARTNCINKCNNKYGMNSFLGTNVISGTIQKDETVTTKYAMSAYTTSSYMPKHLARRMTTYAVTWPGSDLDLAITTPSGKKLTPSSPEVLAYSEEETAEYYVVASDEEGDWLVDVTGIEVDEGGEPYELTVVSVDGAELLNQLTEDTDSDGLPDLWEEHFFGDLTQDGNADSDGDGVSNLREFQENLNPVNEDTDGDGKLDGDEITVAPASCQLYAVNDKGLNNSQFFTVSLDDLTVSALGPMYKGHDIESLAIHPETNMIYAASGDNVTNEKQGHFYRVDGENGELFPVGSSGFKEIEDLAFSPDGTLYAWAKGDGLITINLTTGVGTLELPYDKPLIEGLTLKKNEEKVFLGAVGTDLWQYDWETDTLDVICPDKLLGETEALEITPEGLLLIGTHNVPFGLHAFDVETCEVIEADETLSHQYNDVEGIAVPVAACGK